MSCNSCVTSAFILMPFLDGIFIEVKNMPLDLAIIRASEVPERVFDPRSKLKAGVTGNDIIWESMGKDFAEKSLELPIYDLNPRAKKSRLYIGVTKEFANYIRSKRQRAPIIEDLSGETVATKYPRIAKDVFTERSIDNVKFESGGGRIEALQYGYSDWFGILEVRESGRTAERNNIEILEIFYQVTIRLIENADKLTRKDLEILNDLKELIAVALQRARMI